MTIHLTIALARTAVVPAGPPGQAAVPPDEPEGDPVAEKDAPGAGDDPGAR